MKYILTITLCIVSLISYGQDTTYYDYDWNKVSSMNKAHYYEVIQRDQVDTNRVNETIYYKSGQKRTEKNYSVYKDKKLDGKFKQWYESGQLRKDIDYKDGKLNGTLITYWDNGIPKRVDIYENDKFISGRCTNPDGKEITHYDYEKIPEFPGGMNGFMNYLVKEIKYPKKSKRKGIEGRVLLSFIVNKDGSISDIEIVQSVNDELDKEAIRVVKTMPKWEPGMQDGETVRVAFNLPINYSLK